MLEPETLPLERVIYQGELVQIGLFRCPLSRDDFAEAGPIKGHLLVFPRTSVCITHDGREPVIATPNVVMYYNRGQPYYRSPISERGDLCEWFAYAPAVVAEALRPYDLRIEDHWEQPFDFTHGPSDSASYLIQRQIVEHVLAHQEPDWLFVEETSLWVLGRTLERVFEGRGIQGMAANHFQRSLARHLQSILSTRFHEALTLESLSCELGYSPYHLSHVFRRQTGISIHQYLNQIRLRTALERISDGCLNLTELAISLGYSHHSHFTLAFRKSFGVPPSQITDRQFSPRFRYLRKNLIA
jgi:AraC-like DNA-binding protein